MTSEHLDDEAISAHLDGEATPTEAAHVDGCATCRARLAELQGAAEVIGTPVPPANPAAVDAAVTAALDALPPKVVPLASRRRGALPTWLPVAAGLLLVVALVPLFGSLGGGSDDDAGDGASTAMMAEDRAEEESAALDAAGAGAGGGIATIDGGNVGPVDGTGVRQLVEEALGRSDSERSVAESAPAQGGGAGDVAPAPCEDRARDEFPDLGALRYRALGTVEGTEVSVLAFDLPDARVRVLVYAVDDCRITLSQELGGS